MRFYFLAFIACVLVSCKESDLFPNSVEKKEKVVLDGPSKITLNERSKANNSNVLNNSMLPYDYSLIDKKGRELQVAVEAFDGERILAFRKSDSKRFLIELNTLSADSVKHITQKGKFNKPLMSDYLDYQSLVVKFEEAKKIVNLDILVDDSEESELAMEFLRKEKVRFYRVKLTGASLKDKSILREWGVKNVPAFRVGDQVLEGFSKPLISDLIIGAYEQKKK